MPGVLELAQLVQDHGVTEVKVGRGGIDAELDAQRPALAFGHGELGREGAVGQHLDGADREIVDEPLVCHGAAHDTTGVPRPGRSAPSEREKGLR